MQCSTCNCLNSTTVVRCVNCGTTLIYEAVGHSKEYQNAENALDLRMHSGIGAVFGFAIVAVILKVVFAEHWLSDREVYVAAVIAGLVGSVIRLLLFRIKQHV